MVVGEVMLVVVIVVVVDVVAVVVRFNCWEWKTTCRDGNGKALRL